MLNQSKLRKGDEDGEKEVGIYLDEKFYQIYVTNFNRIDDIKAQISVCIYPLRYPAVGSQKPSLTDREVTFAAYPLVPIMKRCRCRVWRNQSCERILSRRLIEVTMYGDIQQMIPLPA